jgi:hypothetical protein
MTLGLILLTLGLQTSGAAAAASTVKPAVPVEPVAAILDAFATHNVVAIDEGAHGNEQGHAFRLTLIRDPRFPTLVNDIVVESGNARYQETMDRFIGGEDVPLAELRRVWQDTTQHAVWDVPIFEEFFRAVRAVNATLPAARKLRVLLGDPPIDWDAVRTAADHFKWLALRDRHAAEVIQREVLAKNRRALVIYGGLHLQRKNIGANYEPFELADTAVSIVARDPAARLFTVWTPTNIDVATLQEDAARWKRPSLALVLGTRLGALDFAVWEPASTTRFALRDGKPSPIAKEDWRLLRMEDQFDAILYLGPPASITHSQVTAALCADAAWLKMRVNRMTLLGHHDQAKALRQRCNP